MAKEHHILGLLAEFERAVEERASFVAAGWERDEDRRTQKELDEARKKITDAIREMCRKR